MANAEDRSGQVDESQEKSVRSVPPAALSSRWSGYAGKYRTSPDQQTDRMPPGVPYIIGNEASERFSFYGMRSILVIFMTSFLAGADGRLAVMNNNEALGWFHQFVAIVYLTPVLGAILSDGLLGKYRTILSLSLIYCAGHAALAINDTRLGLFLGLSFIALGAGGIKPCVAAHVGDQFGARNQVLLARVYGWFYLSINAGSTVAIYFCPILLNDSRFGPRYAFGLPGLLMLTATVVFWCGRNRFVHVPPGGLGFLRELTGREGTRAVLRIASIYVFVAVFWSLWDQSAGGEWTLQARHLDLEVLGFKLLPEQVQIANPILVLLLIPIFSYVIYPQVGRIFTVTPLRKISAGLFLTASAFAVIWWLQTELDAGRVRSVGWQFLAYILLTSGEVLVSVTGLEFSYTQAPKTMKSVVMALWLFTVWLGNEFTAVLNFAMPALRRIGLDLDGAAYFRFFFFLMLLAAFIFLWVARNYRGKTYLQGDEPGP